MLIVLALFSTLVLLSVSFFHEQNLEQQAELLITQVEQAFQYAQAQSILQAEPVVFCGSHEGKICDGDWSYFQRVQALTSHRLFKRFSVRNPHFDLVWQSSLGRNDQLIWNADGSSQQQGTFYVCSRSGDPSLVRGIILLESGRFRLKKDFETLPAACQEIE